jgi:integrase
MMELAYLCLARVGEIRALRRSDATEEGLRLVRAKGSEGEVTTWSPRLRAAVEAAKALHRDAPTPIGGAYLIHDRAGQPIKKNAFDSAWRRLMDKVEAAGIERFTFHDLKAMGISAHKHHHGGHRSAKMRKVYLRKLPSIEATE